MACAKANPDIVGVAAGKIAEDGTTEIIATYVVPVWRRQYLGSELIDHLTNVLRDRGAISMEVTFNWGDERSTGFFASQGWRQRVRVYSRSLLPEEKPPGWRNVVRAWLRRLRHKPIG